MDSAARDAGGYVVRSPCTSARRLLAVERGCRHLSVCQSVLPSPLPAVVGAAADKSRRCGYVCCDNVRSGITRPLDGRLRNSIHHRQHRSPAPGLVRHDGFAGGGRTWRVGCVSGCGDVRSVRRKTRRCAISGRKLRLCRVAWRRAVVTHPASPGSPARLVHVAKRYQ